MLLWFTDLMNVTKEVMAAPDAYLPLARKRQLISDCIKGPLVAACRSPPMKALDRSVETLGL